jgi:hypothetical protein
MCWKENRWLYIRSGEPSMIMIDVASARLFAETLESRLMDLHGAEDGTGNK